MIFAYVAWRTECRGLGLMRCTAVLTQCSRVQQHLDPLPSCAADQHSNNALLKVESSAAVLPVAAAKLPRSEGGVAGSVESPLPQQAIRTQLISFDGEAEELTAEEEAAAHVHIAEVRFANLVSNHPMLVLLRCFA